ncbi:MAG: sulfotransferase [Bacteroidota bacterium]
MQELIVKINGLLEKREAVYPVQDQSYDALLQAVKLLSHCLLEKVEHERSDWTPDQRLIEKTHEFIEQPVFICGGMKTGTTLLTRLLDNHPSLMVMPGDSHYYTHLRDYSGSFEMLCEHWVQRLINPTGQRPFWFLGQNMDDYVRFLLYLDYYLKTNYDTFQSVVAAIFCANPKRSMATMHWVEKKPENERYARWFVRRYPNAKFLHIVRDPLANIAAIKKLNEFKNIPFRAISYSVRLKHLMKIGIDNFNVLGDKTYHFIRYEDLLLETGAALSALSAHLGIPSDENLLIPSENGVPAKANSMYSSNRITGSIAGSRVDQKWKDVLTQKEQEEIVTVLFSTVITQGYKHWSEMGVVNLKKSGDLGSLRIRLKEWLIALKYRLK